MNINLLETNTTSNNYIESMLLSGFTQHIAKPARVTPVSKTLPDHVFHNNILQNTYDVINLSITDRYATKVITQYCRTKEQRVITRVKLICFLPTKIQGCFICVVFMKDCYTPHLLQTLMIIFLFCLKQ